VNPLPIVGDAYVADLTGERALVGGNLNDDGVIDMLDFAALASVAGVHYGSGNTNCGAAAPHGDIDGDGVSFAADFSFISANYARTADLACCDEGLHEGDFPAESVSLLELNRRGLERIAPADSNGDGALDRGELELWIQKSRK
jgi:hypothetical protein